MEVLGWINVRRGNEDLVFKLTDEALLIVAALEDPLLKARLLHLRAASSRLTHSERVASCEECLELFEQAGNEAMRSRALANLGYLNMEAGEFADARRRIRDAIRVFREIGDQRGLALGICNLGFASFLTAPRTRRGSLFNELLRVAHRDGDLGMLRTPSSASRWWPVALAIPRQRLAYTVPPMQSTEGLGLAPRAWNLKCGTPT